MRVVAWNIRAGGGVRADAIARQLARWQADIVALSEFRATPPSARLGVSELIFDFRSEEPKESLERMERFAEVMKKTSS